MLLISTCLVAKNPLSILECREQKKQAEPAISALLQEPNPYSRFKTDISFLIWQAQEDGLEFAARNIPKYPLLANIPTDISASLSTVDFSFAPAFKFLLGYHFFNPYWDFNARWTWFYSRSTRSVHEDLSSAGAGLFPLWIPSQAAIASFPLYSNAKGTLLLLLNNLDLELGFTGGVSPLFFLKLHGGLKAIVINQVFRVRYSGGFFDGTNQMLDSNATAKTKCLGLGPRIGFGSRWILPRGLSLIAEAAGALSLSEIRTKREDHSIGTSSLIPQEIAIRFHEDFWVWRPVIEGKAGIRWEHFFGASKKQVLDVELAYEIQEYWEQNMLTRYADAAIFYVPFTNKGHLTLQGFSLTAALGY